MKRLAPAKVNLSLRILGRRDDGYHALRSWMSPIALADQLDVDLDDSPTLAFTCSDPTVPADSRNLAVLAAGAFSKATGISIGGRMHLEKHVPHGAGLGGGSSDAATVLHMLNDLTKAGLGVAELETIAATLGSDVPFFIQENPAWISGRGEEVNPVPLPQTFWLVLIKPPFPVPTGWAYSAWAARKSSGHAIEFGGVEWANDLECAVFEKFVALPVIQQWLLSQPEVRVARMSGSGSTIFGVCDSADEAIAVANAARAYFGPTFFVCSTRTGSA